eukprot:IDg16548t1
MLRVGVPSCVAALRSWAMLQSQAGVRAESIEEECYYCTGFLKERTPCTVFVTSRPRRRRAAPSRPRSNHRLTKKSATCANLHITARTTMTPLPISAAASALITWTLEQAKSPRPEYRAHVAVRVDSPGLLTWLRAQPHSEKLYFRDRASHLEVAAVAFAAVRRGATLTDEHRSNLRGLLRAPGARVYGAQRFDDGSSAPPDEVREAAPHWA